MNKITASLDKRDSVFPVLLFGDVKLNDMEFVRDSGWGRRSFFQFLCPFTIGKKAPSEHSVPFVVKLNRRSQSETCVTACQKGKKVQPIPS